MELARKADELAVHHAIDILFTAPSTELVNIVQECPNLVVTAQHVDDVSPGASMGKVSIESLVDIGVQAAVLNHADHPLSLSTLVHIVQRAKQKGLKTIICADSVLEAQAIALLQPDIVLAEPTEQIGQSQISSRDYVTSTIKKIKEINPNVLVEQGAGIRSEKDVEELFRLGADGVGVTSGIVKAAAPIEMMEKMMQAVSTINRERK